MANVQNFDGFVVRNAEEYLIAVTPNDLYSNARIVGLLASQWTDTDKMDTGIDGSQHALSASRTAFLNILKNLIDIGERLSAISNFHTTPRAFQKASTSSSDARRLWRALAIACRSSSVNA